jgi:hypothetical protein
VEHSCSRRPRSRAWRRPRRAVAASGAPARATKVASVRACPACRPSKAAAEHGPAAAAVCSNGPRSPLSIRVMPAAASLSEVSFNFNFKCYGFKSEGPATVAPSRMDTERHGRGPSPGPVTQPGRLSGSSLARLPSQQCCQVCGAVTGASGQAGRPRRPIMIVQRPQAGRGHRDRSRSSGVELSPAA